MIKNTLFPVSLQLFTNNQKSKGDKFVESDEMCKT